MGDYSDLNLHSKTCLILFLILSRLVEKQKLHYSIFTIELLIPKYGFKIQSVQMFTMLPSHHVPEREFTPDNTHLL